MLRAFRPRSFAFAVVIVVALVTAGLLTGRFVADAYRGYARFPTSSNRVWPTRPRRLRQHRVGPHNRPWSSWRQRASCPAWDRATGHMRGQGMGMANAESVGAVSGTPGLVAPGDVLPLAPWLTPPPLPPYRTRPDGASGAVGRRHRGRSGRGQHDGHGQCGTGHAGRGLPRAIWWSGVAAAVVALAADSLLLANLLRPLRRLQGGVRRGRRRPQRIDVHGRDELGQLAAGFNHMAATLEQQETLRRTMVADIAHELRTPISVIQGNLQAILDGVYPGHGRSRDHPRGDASAGASGERSA
ncbi:MAG: HAMP domain-containing protein [Caldilineaceae bacterium]